MSEIKLPANASIKGSGVTSTNGQVNQGYIKNTQPTLYNAGGTTSNITKRYTVNPVNTGGNTGLIGGASATNVGSSATGTANRDAYVSQVTSEINDYTNKLLSMAGENYDFVAKWVEANYKKALGSDDVATQQFLKSVASNLEETRGRVVYDYETGKYQLEKQTGMLEERSKQAQQMALQRLADDERIANADLKRVTGVERNQLNSSLNSRGLISDARTEQTGLGGEEIGLQEEDIQARFDALARTRQLGEQQTNFDTASNLADLAYAKEVGLEDLTTTARRTGIDEIQSRQQQLEEAQIKKRRAEEEARAQQKIELAKLERQGTSYGGQTG
jgi:hypothetical protein